MHKNVKSTCRKAHLQEQALLGSHRLATLELIWRHRDGLQCTALAAQRRSEAGNLDLQCTFIPGAQFNLSQPLISARMGQWGGEHSRYSILLHRFLFSSPYGAVPLHHQSSRPQTFIVTDPATNTRQDRHEVRSISRNFLMTLDSWLNWSGMECSGCVDISWNVTGSSRRRSVLKGVTRLVYVALEGRTPDLTT